MLAARDSRVSRRLEQVLSKRKLIQLVEGKHVKGWSDPRMPTLAGIRRRSALPSCRVDEAPDQLLSGACQPRTQVALGVTVVWSSGQGVHAAGYEALL